MSHTESTGDGRAGEEQRSAEQNPVWRAACGRGARPGGTAPRGLQGRRAQGRAPSSLHPPGQLVPCKRKPVPTSSALEASASFQENGFQFSRRWYVNGNDGDGLL